MASALDTAYNGIAAARNLRDAQYFDTEAPCMCHVIDLERRNCEGDEKRSNLLTLKIDDLTGQLASVNRIKGLQFKLNVVTRWSSRR